jgi:hypothetical protein
MSKEHFLGGQVFSNSLRRASTSNIKGYLLLGASVTIDQLTEGAFKSACMDIVVTRLAAVT